MTLTPDDVRRIADLARIEVTADEVADVHAKLESIFDLLNELKGIDTAGIVPMAHAQDVTTPLRDDVVTEGNLRAIYQAGAPRVADGLYLVPKVIE